MEQFDLLSHTMIRLKRQQVREVDHRAIGEYHIPGIVLMENASRAVADAAAAVLVGSSDMSAMILCGGGNNGGDGLAVARHLHNRGMAVSIGLCVDPANYQGDALLNWRIVQAMKLETFQATPEHIARTDAFLLIDAIFGTGLSSAPRDPFAAIADAIESTDRPVIAIDVPSGLDCDTGEPLGACVRASQTVTFVAEKFGFANPHSRKFTGIVTVADIGCPRELIQAIAGEPLPQQIAT